MSGILLRPRALTDATWLSVVVAAPPTVQQPDDLRVLPAAAYLIELRHDLLREVAADVSVADWIEAAPRPVLFTVRSRSQGGAFDGSAAEANALRAEARAAGAFLVDDEDWAQAAATDLASVHGPQALTQPPREGLEKRAFAVEDAEALEQLRRALPAPSGTSLVPYGALGALRPLTLAGRGRLLFGHGGEAVVGGQPALSELLEDLRAGEVGPEARLYGLLGRPPGSSPSPAFFNGLFRASEDDALYVPLPAVDVATALALPFHGYSVTTPHKVEVAARADRRGTWVERTGAANTLFRSDAGWQAANTDALAIEELLPTDVSGVARVYGAGGYARAFVAVLRARGLEVEVLARRPEAARALAAAFDDPVRAVDLSTWQGSDAAVWVNATPAGRVRDEPHPFLANRLRNRVFMDAPYIRGGGHTALVRFARDAGAECVVDGPWLLEVQALKQARLLRAGADMHLGLLESIWRGAYAPGPSVVLIGHRGVGKSTVGRALARGQGRAFLDLDVEILRITGRSPATWIEEAGVAVFRALEAEALERALGRRGAVIATGGGIVESTRCQALLGAHERVLWLDAPDALLAERIEGSSAPHRTRLEPGLTLREELGRLRRVRSPHWEHLAHRRVDASLPVEALVAILSATW